MDRTGFEFDISYKEIFLDLASENGALVQRQMVSDIELVDGRPYLKTINGHGQPYDLMVIATGVNSHLMDQIEALDLGFRRPKTSTAFISEATPEAVSVCPMLVLMLPSASGRALVSPPYTCCSASDVKPILWPMGRRP